MAINIAPTPPVAQQQLLSLTKIIHFIWQNIANGKKKLYETKINLSRRKHEKFRNNLVRHNNLKMLFNLHVHYATYIFYVLHHTPARNAFRNLDKK